LQHLAIKLQTGFLLDLIVDPEDGDEVSSKW
jgi:hypothetical protein